MCMGRDTSSSFRNEKFEFPYIHPMKKSLLFLIIALAVFISSCITVEERYFFNRDGSGSMEYILDLSEIAGLMKMTEDSSAGEEMEFLESFEEALSSLKSVNDIHEVQMSGFPDEYIYGIRYDFDNIGALNQAMNILLKEGEGYHNYFRKKGKRKFYRIQHPGEDRTKEELLGDEMDEEFADEILKSMKYKLSFAFERDVKKVETTGNVVESEISNQVLIDNNFKAITDDPAVMDVFIRTK